MEKSILLTTAISYTNGSPHIGHLYEAVLADFIKRVHLLSGIETKLLTGTDEHGKKIQTTAQELKIKAIELCDKYSKEFEQMNTKLNSSFDYFIRTTSSIHKELVSNTIKNILSSKNESKSIYLGEYSGYYNIREECYVTETQASQTNYCDPVSSKPFEIVKEPTYYFVLDNYQNQINQTVETISPEYFQDEIKTRLEKGLDDLSITRTTFSWGIPFSDSSEHILYVWFDALLNYVTGKKILYGEQNIIPIHIIGKDILWFHSVIYPAILKAGGLEKLLPKKILTHGFILDKDGKKMSKSLQNVITNQELFDSYPVEAIRYYLISNTILGQDFKFDPDNLINLYNNVLIKDFGNLFQRISKIAKSIEENLNKFFEESKDKINIVQTKSNDIIKTFLLNWNFFDYNAYLNGLITNLNKILTETKPWTLDVYEQVFSIGNILIDFHSVMCLMLPIIPTKILELACYWGWENKLNFLGNLELKFKHVEKIIAFNKIEIKKVNEPIKQQTKINKK